MRCMKRIARLSFSSVEAGTTNVVIAGVSVSAITIAPPIANAYVRAIGEKITPDTPLIVNSGKNAAPMINVENAIGRPTSPAAA